MSFIRFCLMVFLGSVSFLSLQSADQPPTREQMMKRAVQLAQKSSLEEIWNAQKAQIALVIDFMGQPEIQGENIMQRGFFNPTGFILNMKIMELKLALPATPQEAREKVANEIKAYIGEDGSLYKAKAYLESNAPDRTDVINAMQFIIDQLEQLQRRLNQ